MTKTKASTETNVLLGRITERPLMVAPEGVEGLASALDEFTAHDSFGEWMSPQARHTDESQTDEEFFSAEEYGRPYSVVNGVLQVPVMGMLLNRFSRTFGTSITGYQYIERAVARGMTDPEVRGIALVIDSNGGEAAGAFELTDKIAEGRGVKPVRAFVSDKALSAAYAIASAADQIIVTQAGATGSIGVMAMHVSREKQLEQDGLEVTFIFKGKHKVDGNSFQALSASVKAQFQKRIDKAYAQFTETVARNRNMGQDAVEDTEALVYDSDESVEAGLADKIGALNDEMIAFTDELDPNSHREGTMSTKTAATAPTIPEGYVSPDAHATALAEAGQTAVANERARVSAVQANDAYKGREVLAAHLLGTTEMSAEDIGKTLAISPIAAPAAEVDAAAAAAKVAADAAAAATGGSDQFAAHMNADGHPDVGADPAGGEQAKEGGSTALLAAYRAAGGVTIDRTAQK